MYSEPNRRTAARRSDDAFLRRMLGGELTGGSVPSAAARRSPAPTEQVTCDGTRRADRANAASECPTHIPAPAVAMVYSPRQCWRAILDPEAGLAQGSIFTELVLPLEAAQPKCGKEVFPRLSL